MRKLILLLSVFISTFVYSQDVVVFQKGKKYGFKNKTNNKIIIKPKYYNAKDFNNGIAPVRPKKKYSYWIYINQKRKPINDKKYSYASVFFNGIALVKNYSPYSDIIAGSDISFYFINTSGNKIENPSNDVISSFFEHIKEQDLKSYFRGISTLNNKEPLYLSKVRDLQNNLLLNNRLINIGNEKWYIDTNYLVKGPFIYDEFKATKCEGSEQIVVKKGNKYGVIDIKGNILVDFIYDDILTCFGKKTGIGAAKMGNKWGFIDKNGKALSLFSFDEIEPFKLYKDIYLIKKKSQFGDDWMELDLNDQTVKKYIWIYGN